MLILFRADANTKIGMGHIMRCFAVAEELKKKNAACVFLTSDMTSKEVIERQGYSCIMLETNYDCLANEIREVKDVIISLEADAIFIDTHYATFEYIVTLKEMCLTIYMDDLNDFYAPADILVNYNIYAFEEMFDEKYMDSGIKLLLGTAYAPLRSEFQKRAEYFVRETVKNVIVLAGGSDPSGASLILLDEIIRHDFNKNRDFHLVIGKMNECREQIEKKTSKAENIYVHTDVDNIRTFMEDADMAVSAAGVTLYELSAIGTPTIGYSLVDNQIPNAEEFEKQGLILNAGDCRNKECFVKRFSECFEMLDHSYETRDFMSKKMRERIDGKGAWRIAGEVYCAILKNRKERME